jgi:indolepyruvate ferredoxin oxidoreductase beta subunit
MAKGEIVVDERACKACGICVVQCKPGCISLDKERIGPRGTPVAYASGPEKCTGCGVCGWLCPDYAIEVYKLIESEVE